MRFNIPTTKIIWSAVIGSMLLIVLIAPRPIDDTKSNLIAYFASLTGYLAAVLLLWQFALGTRAVHGLISRDLVKSNSLHKTLGTYGMALIAAHPILITAKYAEPLGYIFFGTLETEFDNYVAYGRGAFLITLFVWVTSAILRSRIAYRPWKYLHYSSYLLLPLLIIHPLGIGTFLLTSSAFKALWAIHGLSFALLVLLRIRQFATWNQRPHKLVHKERIAEDVYAYTLVPIAEPLAPKPGQFLYIRNGFWSEEHPFSVALHDPATGQLTLITKVTGPFTKKFTHTKVGSTVYVDGPYGVFTQNKPPKNTPITFIAGGVGITPFLQQVLNDTDQRITLFNANRTRKNVIMRAELKKQLGSRYIEVFSKDNVPDANKGMITAELIKKHLKNTFLDQTYYICGPPPMMQAVQNSLITHGVDPAMIHTESFSF